MSLERSTTQTIVKKYRLHERDTASPQVQIELLTERLNQLNGHFQTHVKDHHSRRGLLKLVGRRKRLLSYLHQRDPGAYRTLIGDLGIRK